LIFAIIRDAIIIIFAAAFADSIIMPLLFAIIFDAIFHADCFSPFRYFRDISPLRLRALMRAAPRAAAAIFAIDYCFSLFTLPPYLQF